MKTCCLSLVSKWNRAYLFVHKLIQSIPTKIQICKNYATVNVFDQEHFGEISDIRAITDMDYNETVANSFLLRISCTKIEERHELPQLSSISCVSADTATHEMKRLLQNGIKLMKLLCNHTGKIKKCRLYLQKADLEMGTFHPAKVHDMDNSQQLPRTFLCKLNRYAII